MKILHPGDRKGVLQKNRSNDPETQEHASDANSGPYNLSGQQQSTTICIHQQAETLIRTSEQNQLEITYRLAYTERGRNAASESMRHPPAAAFAINR